MAQATATKSKRATPRKPAAKETPKKPEGKFWEATGRRKTAVARVRLRKSAKNSFTVNGKPVEEYFQEPENQIIATEALRRAAGQAGFEITVLVRGGGPHAQAVALRHGIARALLLWDNSLRGTLKTLGFLTRDPRMRERKKFGLKRARRARQWRKR